MVFVVVVVLFFVFTFSLNKITSILSSAAAACTQLLMCTILKHMLLNWTVLKKKKSRSVLHTFPLKVLTDMTTSDLWVSSQTIPLFPFVQLHISLAEEVMNITGGNRNTKRNYGFEKKKKKKKAEFGLKAEDLYPCHTHIYTLGNRFLQTSTH